ncbi:MAG: PIN domain-containing protein, partial [Cyanobacteria bacterium J06555_12]
LDTNVFVAAGFNRRSRSAQLVEQVRTHQLQMVWHQLTRKETQFIVGKIPPLSWEAIADLFEPAEEYEGELILDAYDYISDSEDRKFAALCHATQAPLVTMDRGLLAARDVDSLPILSPHEYVLTGRFKSRAFWVTLAAKNRPTNKVGQTGKK